MGREFFLLGFFYVGVGEVGIAEPGDEFGEGLVVFDHGWVLFVPIKLLAMVQ